MQVDHDYKLHAEIRYETLSCFGMTSAVGNTYQELLIDIKSRLDYYKDRDPEILNVYYDPNGEKIDITQKILTMIRRK
tara:strand:- start:474 stop:707 length:234 start_codon:yes stop_codon:yes gene_type:complete